MTPETAIVGRAQRWRLANFDRWLAYDRDVIFKRLALGILGVLAAAVMISAATHAVDFENSTIEDGDGRFVIAGVAGVVFLGCLYFLVSNLATARWTKRMTEAIDTEQSDVDDQARRGLRLEVATPSTRLTPRPSSLPVSDRLSPTTPEATGTAGTTSESAGQGRSLFGVTAEPSTPRSVSGLFGIAEPSVPPAEIESPATRTAEPEVSQPAKVAPIALQDYQADEPNRIDDELAASGNGTSPEPSTASDEIPPTAEDIRTMLFVAPVSDQPRATAPSAVPLGPPQDELPRWQVVVIPDDDADQDMASDGSDDDEPPSTGYLYATGG